MFGASVEKLKRENECLVNKVERLGTELESALRINSKQADEIKALKWDLECLERRAQLDLERKINELRAAMQESLIKSDLARVEAMARLEVYEKTDTKKDANTIKEMIGKLIDQIGKQRNDINIVK